MSTAEVTRRHLYAAWAVHGLTGAGVIVGYGGLNSVMDGHPRAAMLWLIGALVLDGVDGPIARALDVRRRAPEIDGNALDLIIDYFTCTIVPVAFLYRFDVLPLRIGGPIGLAILFVSALWMARRVQETPDGWFLGFPAEWNMIIPTLYLLGTDQWVNVGVCMLFIALTLTRIEFPHPVAVQARRPVSIAFLVVWLGAMTWLAIAQHDVILVRVALAIAPIWMMWQVVERLVRGAPVGPGHDVGRRQPVAPH